ncbi:hypothetical protein GLOIN_2v1765974 [Rhizophagus irregularis DAOM 181602=DAOM 197198]|uniref:Uncharacterized protein n=1 Tax=Rhizophagus irregularis (strain DAOM 181602 / DAOM 197198 / MUCL 43194) TaxID=747089 RepID=A0A2P4QND4_RHIID|nr:hypothetical protein GLOIN_2v1765974 [Rhizophagus irregularis DAOM 181602=DAOM 197198]POG79167.1 hypothetical protein GLOIN_2v1765974 [Rhizophagus irregularis DAOM 181602=DAOM 197198]|eukprot:XP_025186033.1 hypothetical protein GLOIN_2v1765974 [Rhizophagus irregularis DAOM 181602=DAOM 197198]
MERKRKVKETISNDSEDDYNFHQFTIVMERIVLKMHVFKNILIKKKKQQAVNNIRSKLDDDDISSDNSELSRLKKISKHAKLNQHSFDLSINEHEPIPKPKVGRKYLDIRKVLNIEKEKYNSYWNFRYI